MLQTRHLNFLFLLLFALSCQTEPEKNYKSNKSDQKAIATAEKREEAAKGWDAWWPIFQKAVTEGDVETLANQIEFPLKGSEVYNDGKQISKATFSQHFSKMFDETVRATIAETDNMSDFLTKNQQVADQLQVPANKKIRTMMVLYVTDKGEEYQTESSVTFQFVEVNPEVFKLYSLVTAG